MSKYLKKLVHEANRKASGEGLRRIRKILTNFHSSQTPQRWPTGKEHKQLHEDLVPRTPGFPLVILGELLSKHNAPKLSISVGGSGGGSIDAICCFVRDDSCFVEALSEQGNCRLFSPFNPRFWALLYSTTNSSQSKISRSFGIVCTDLQKLVIEIHPFAVTKCGNS